MPRCARVDVGGEVYHVLNRANGRLKMFETDADYLLFEEILNEVKELIDMRILAYTLMPNHWHIALYPRNDGDLGTFMHRLTNAHTRKVHAKTNTNGSGHLYQGRYKSFLVESDNYLLTLIKYIERNPVRSNIVQYPSEWRWGSAWRRGKGTLNQQALLAPLPVPFPTNYHTWINELDAEVDLIDIRNAITRGVPYGGESWVDKMIDIHELHSTVQAIGRPRKR
ncbi:transposase [Candidatus Kaiserbacteria bacterium]|nr:MAG: transposase [Candidatus Kaiserbacteria bacterium]